MKHRFNNSEAACHEFVHNYKTNDSIYCTNVFSEGNILYSYGNHFAMCKVIELTHNRVKQEVFLVNNNSYSSTTARHMSHLRYSIPSYNKIFYVNDPTDSHLSNFRVMMREAVYSYNEIQSAIQQRKKDRLLIQLDTEIVKIKEFVNFFKVTGLKLSGLEYQLYHKEINNDNIALFIEADKKAKSKAKRKQINVNKQRIEVFNSDVVKWVNGEINTLITPSFIDEIHFRLSSHKTYIETSKNARLSIDEAKRLVNDYHNNDCINKSYGNLRVNTITTEYITIGCHKISIVLFEKYATLLIG